MIIDAAEIARSRKHADRYGRLPKENVLAMAYVELNKDCPRAHVANLIAEWESAARANAKMVKALKEARELVIECRETDPAGADYVDGGLLEKIDDALAAAGVKS